MYPLNRVYYGWAFVICHGVGLILPFMLISGGNLMIYPLPSQPEYILKLKKQTRTNWSYKSCINIYVAGSVMARKMFWLRIPLWNFFFEKFCFHPLTALLRHAVQKYFFVFPFNQLKLPLRKPTKGVFVEERRVARQHLVDQDPQRPPVNRLNIWEVSSLREQYWESV